MQFTPLHCLLSLIIMHLSFLHAFLLLYSSFIFYFWIIFHGTDVLQSVYPFAFWAISWWLLVWLIINKATINNTMQVSVWLRFQSVGLISKTTTDGSNSRTVQLARDWQTVFQTHTSFCIPTSNKWEFLLLYILTSIWHVRHSNYCAAMPHCCLNLQCHDDKWQ